MSELTRAWKKTVGNELLWILFGCLVYLYFLLFRWPNTPFYQGADQAYFMEHAKRMLRGQMMYRDFFEYLTPGTDLVYLSLFKVFGVRAWIPSLTILVLGFAITWLTVAISRNVMDKKASLLSGLLFLVLGYRFFLNGTHHWFSVLATMAATSVLIRERSPARICCAGVFCAFALFFTPLRGALAAIGLGVFLLWEYRREKQTPSRFLKNEAILIGPFVAVSLLENVYFVTAAGARKFFYSTVIFLLKYYPSELYGSWRAYMIDIPRPISIKTLPQLGACLLMYGMVPLIYLLFFACVRRVSPTQPREPWNCLMLINITGLFLFLSVANSPIWIRLAVVSPPAWILLLWLIHSPGRLNGMLRGTLWAGTVAWMIATPLKTQRSKVWYLDARVGRTAFSNPIRYQKYRWVLERTRPGEFFFGSYNPDVYYSAGLQNPSEVPLITRNDFTRPEQVENIVDALDKKRVRYVLWAQSQDVARSAREHDNLPPLRAYLSRHYHVVETFADGDQAWERNP